MLFVMSDTAWATIPRLRAFVDPSTSQISAAEREFGRRVLAYYFFTGLANQEFGTLGYEDEGHTYTKNFKKLFEGMDVVNRTRSMLAGIRLAGRAGVQARVAPGPVTG